MAREFLTGIKSENRLSNIRLIMPNDPVIGGQPSDNANEFTSNTPFLDLACSIQYSLNEIKRIDAKPSIKVWDSLGDSKTEPGSQRTINEVNKLAKAAQTAANQANDKANTANTAAATADKKAVVAQNKADSAYNLANTKTTEAWVKQQKYITALDIPILPGQIFIFHTKDGASPAGYIARNGQAIDKNKMPKLFAEYGANMPDDRNRVYRMEGNLAGAAGSTQEDAMQKINGTFVALSNDRNVSASSAFSYKTIDNKQGFSGISLNEHREFTFDSSKVTRTADETRVKSRIVIFCNKIQ